MKFMSQDLSVMAFRKRLRLRGYRDIHIINHGRFYHVSYIEPVSGQVFEYGVTVSRMINSFNRRFK